MRPPTLPARPLGHVWIAAAPKPVSSPFITRGPHLCRMIFSCHAPADCRPMTLTAPAEFMDVKTSSPLRGTIDVSPVMLT